jgi:hypothetical protein
MFISAGNSRRFDDRQSGQDWQGMLAPSNAGKEEMVHITPKKVLGEVHKMNFTRSEQPGQYPNPGHPRSITTSMYQFKTILYDSVGGFQDGSRR